MTSRIFKDDAVNLQTRSFVFRSEMIIFSSSIAAMFIMTAVYDNPDDFAMSDNDISIVPIVLIILKNVGVYIIFHQASI